MTLLEIERLARKIVAALQSPPEAAVLLKLAEDFAATCRTANARLAQCEAMLDAGDVPLAIQIAETAPNLLDFVSRLEFREAEQWRSVCANQRLPAAERIEDRAVQKLNEAYAQGIKVDDKLYKSFRAAMIARKDFEALTIARTIRRLNPNDSNAATEVARLDAKVLDSRLTFLRSLLDSGAAPAEITTAVESVEAGGFETAPTGDEWRRAQERRCVHLLDEAESARRIGDWRLCLTYLDLCRSLEEDFSLIFEAAFQSRLATVRQWASAQLEEHRLATEFSQVLAELEHLLAQNEEKDTAARMVPVEEIKADYEILHRQWRKVRDYTRPVPGGLEARFQKRTSLLAAEIARRNRRRIASLATVAVAVLLVLGAAGWFTLRHIKAGDFACQLDAAIKSRQLRTAERLLTQLRESETSLLGVGTLSASAGKADTFIAHEKSLLKTFEEAFALLPSPPVSGRPYQEIATTQERFQAAGKLFEGLPSDVQDEVKPRMTSFQVRWEQVLEDEAPVLTAAFKKELALLRQTSARLNYTGGVEAARTLLNESAPVMVRVEQLAPLSVGSLQVKADLRQQASETSTRIKGFADDLHQHETALTVLRGAQSFEDLITAVSLLGKSKFRQVPAVEAAISWRADVMNSEALFQKLVTPSNPGLLAYLKNTTEDRFIPKAAMPAEVKILEELRTESDESLPLRRWKLQPDSAGSPAVEWIAFGTPSQEDGSWYNVRAYEVSGTSKSFAMRMRNYGLFDGKYRMTPKDMLSSLTDVGPCHETDCLTQFNLSALSPVNDVYPQPLLPALSAVVDGTSGSILLRAYLFTRLTELMLLQPEAWGLAFSPTAIAHRAELNRITGQLKSGDWFVPSVDNDRRPLLEAFFRTARNTDYMGEARTFASLARIAWNAGPRYAGYVDADGKLQILPNLSPKEVWGFNASGGPVLLFTASQATSSSTKAAKLSPLYVFGATRAELLARARSKSDVPIKASQLPPLFDGLKAVQ